VGRGNPKDSSNIIGVYQQDRYAFGGARGLAAAVSHDGGASWSSTYPPFSTCAGGTEANGGDFQRASDPWLAFAPNGDAYFISLSVSFVGLDDRDRDFGEQIHRRRGPLERACNARARRG
jgi:hypothetical protein